MAHVRKLIRDDIKSTLTGLATTGTRVYQSRVYPIDSSKLPGILIYNKNETVEYQSISLPRGQMRTSVFAVEVYVKGTTNYDNSLDQICLEIEQAMYNDVTRAGYAKDTRIISFEADFNGDGDQPVAVATLTIEVLYRVSESNPGAAIQWRLPSYVN